MGFDFIDSKEKLKKHLEDLNKRLDAVKSLPEWSEYLEKRDLYDGFIDSQREERIEKTYQLIIDIIENGNVQEMVDKIKSFERKLSDIKWKQHVSFCSSNIMDHVFDVFKKYGTETEVGGEFSAEAYNIKGYTMEVYYGQGEYGYSIYVQKRIF